MDKMTAKVLVIDDDRAVCITCKRILEEEGHTVEYTLSAAEGIDLAVKGRFDLVLLDLKMPNISGMDVLQQILKSRPDQAVIIITGYATIQTSIEAIKHGAFDYLPKPFTPEELALSVDKALEDRRLRSENEYLKQELSRSHQVGDIIGRSTAMSEIFTQIVKIAPTDFTVMIYGESGTGKELIAQAIHKQSLRADKPYVAVDMSAVNPNLVESEMFGHVRGAFTGAAGNRPGYFTIANGGTLFLDEVSNISLELQGKLLRVLESHKLRPVGSDHEQSIDIRLITATNRDLYKMIEAGTFREDLYYRLNVIPITVPPLRERAEDIPLLAMHFLERAKHKTATEVQGFTTEAMAKLISYAWPGNVRELKNIVERLVGLATSELIDLSQLPPEISGARGMGGDLALAEVPATMEGLKDVKRRIRDKVYEDVERAFVLQALEKNTWNVSKAAEAVGMLRPNFHALMRKYGIKRGE